MTSLLLTRCSIIGGGTFVISKLAYKDGDVLHRRRMMHMTRSTMFFFLNVVVCCSSIIRSGTFIITTFQNKDSDNCHHHRMMRVNNLVTWSEIFVYTPHPLRAALTLVVHPLCQSQNCVGPPFKYHHHCRRLVSHFPIHFIWKFIFGGLFS